MQPRELEQYLHDHIPLTRAMAVEVISVTPDAVVLAAPLEPNINHRDTVFGGSAASLATLAAWSLLSTRTREEGLSCKLVIQRSTMEFVKPIAGIFYARSSLEKPESWTQFAQTLVRRGRGRITVDSLLEFEGQVAARFSGGFVALSSGSESASVD